MFRRLYWVTEQADPQGNFRATGVYTSTHDLAERGLRRLGPSGEGFRINLIKLDCQNDVLGTWSGPSFSGLEQSLGEYVATGEFSVEELQALRVALDAFSSAAITK